MTVSVALCTYNGEQFIKEQIDSILNQTVPVNEIIICDDRSNDTTIEILEQYSIENPGIFKIFINETNLRSVKNFEKAITLCSGDIIFLSDQDDIWVPNKVEAYLDYFDKNPQIEVLTSNGYCINEQSEVEDKYAVWDVPYFLREKKIAVNYYAIITQIANLATGASMAIKRSILPEMIPFPVIKDFHHDEWIAIISSRKNAFELLHEKYFYYRIHSNQQVGGVFHKKNNEIKKKLTNYFILGENDSPLYLLKRKLKRLSNAYKRNRNLLENGGQHAKIFEDNLIQIEKAFNEANWAMNKKYPLSSSILKVTDKIFNKRQLKKIN
ncbi:MAG: hypothetical protein RL494_193 [Bacteroidota bacterium]